MTFRRCSVCALNWPNVSTWARCGQCNRATSVMTREDSDDAILSADEANTLAMHVRFEQYLQGEETESQRRARHAKIGGMPHIDEDPEFRSNKTKFDAIIRASRYTEQERRVIQELEAQLPSAHLHRDDD